jgi:hypothetical protein
MLRCAFETAALRPPQGEARLEAREASQDEPQHRALRKTSS